MKRVLRTLLIAVMAAMLMALPAMAAGAPSVGVGSASAKAGESVTLDISISSNPGFVSGKVTVTYDTAALELTGLSNVMFAGDAYAPTGMANHSSVDPVTGDGVLVSATFKVKEGTADGAYNVSASVSGMRDGNDALMTVNGGSGTITVTTPHTHTFGEWTVKDAATCTTDGVEIRTCACGEYETRTGAPATGHTYGDWTVAKAVTCTTAGVETRTCACGASETKEIPATGHTYGDWTVTKAATCTAAGVETRTCACGAAETKEIPAKGHSFGDWAVTKAATCTAAGVETRTCACGAAETKEISAKGHSFGAWTMIKDSNCTETGSEQRTCSACGAVETSTINAEGHDLIIQSDGSGHWYICSKCGYSTVKEAHAFDANGKCGCGYANAPKLDNVPKTGDITPMLVLASMIFVCMVGGTAFVYGRRKSR